METRANYVVVGAFVLVVIAGMFLAVLWLAHAQFNRAHAYYDIYFSGSVTGLNIGATVHYNGIQVGRVSDIRLDPENVEQVRVTVELDPDFVIKQDAVAELQTNLLSGLSTVEISGGSRDASTLQALPGQRYPRIASRQGTIESVVSSMPEAMQRLNLIADRLATLLDERNRQAFAETLDNLRQMSAKGAARTDALLDESEATLKDLHATVASAKEAMAQVRETLAKADGVASDAQSAIKGYGELARRLNDTATHLDAMVQENRPGVRDFSQHGLTQLTALLSDARTLVTSLTRVASELERDPSRFLYGDRREGYRPR